MAVLFTNLADGHEAEVAVGADVVVAVVALEAVEAGSGVWDWVCADVAVCCDGEDLVGFERWGGCAVGCGGGWVAVGWDAADWEKSMGAASSLVHAAVAKTPVTFIALVTLPVTVVGWRLAAIAEEAGG